MDGTARRLLGLEAEAEFFQRGAGAFDLDEDALRRIVDPAGKLQFLCEPEDERPEAHPLHGAAQRDFQARD